MTRVVVMMSVSLDGFMAGPNGELDWQLMDDELHRHFSEWLGLAGGFLDGRITYELMAGFWPTADADPSCPDVVAEFARIWREMPKVVYSTTLERADWNTEVVREVVPEDVMTRKATAGGDLVVGGADLAATFRRLDLVDEYRIYVHPVLIGQGKELFPAGSATGRLRLAETRTFGSGVVLLRYERPDVA